MKRQTTLSETVDRRPKWFQDRLKVTAELIKSNRKIFLACHANPGGDANGSMLGLGLALTKIGKVVTMLCPDPIPLRYIKLPGVHTVKRQCKGTADLAISVACGSI